MYITFWNSANISFHIIIIYVNLNIFYEIINVYFSDDRPYIHINNNCSTII